MIGSCGTSKRSVKTIISLTDAHLSMIDRVSADAVFGEAIYLQIAHRNLPIARLLTIFLYIIAIIVVIIDKMIYTYLLLLSLSKQIDMRKGVALCHAELSFPKALLSQIVDRNFEKVQALHFYFLRNTGMRSMGAGTVAVVPP